MVAGDLEALSEAAALQAEREGDADVAALVRTAWKCDRQWRLMLFGFSNGGSSQESPCCKEDEDVWQQLGLRRGRGHGVLFLLLPLANWIRKALDLQG